MKQALVMLCVLIGGGVSLAACDATIITRPSDVELGSEFTLAPGDSVRVGETSLRVSFERVVEDSRCPSDAVCVTAGRVVIEIKAGTSDGSRYELSPEQSTTVGGYRVRLLRVEPYPSSAAPIEPSRYRATFIVDRA